MKTAQEIIQAGDILMAQVGHFCEIPHGQIVLFPVLFNIFPEPHFAILLSDFCLL